MRQITDLHNKAMIAAEGAEVHKLRGNPDKALPLLQEALRYEKEAALLARRDPEEPTLSVLHRSATSLALECGELDEAEKLIAYALSCSPPEIIADELRDLLEQVYFNRHLELRGITLQPNYNKVFPSIIS